MRSLVVTGLLAGLIGMHHLLAMGPAEEVPAVPVASATVSMEQGPMEHGGGRPLPSTPPASPTGGHDDHESGLWHACMAVMIAAAMLVLGWLLCWRPGDVAARCTVQIVRAWSTPRAPPRGAPARLALLCVSRT